MNGADHNRGVESALRVEELIARAAARHPERAAIIFADRRRTYAATLAELDRRAARLIEHGAHEGDVILTAAPLNDDFLLTFLACCRAGLLFLPLATQTAPAELAALAARANPRFILTIDGLPHPALPDYSALPLALPGEAGGDARRAALARSRDGGPDVLAFARQTSGTTRRLPKLALRAHRQLTARVDPARWLWWYDPERVYCLLSPDQFYIADTCQIFALGATLVQMTDIHPRRLERALLRHGGTDLWTVPAALHALATLTSPAPPGLRLRTIRTASMRLPVELRRAIEGRYGATVAQQYSTTEAGTLTATARTGTPEGSVGRPLPGVTMRLIDEAGRDVPEGEAGEIIARSPAAMLGYLGEPEQTAATLRDGWVHTGDLARRDPEGNYFLLGRRAQWINVGGAKVLPEEVEQVLEEHPAVREAAVTSADDAARGAIVRAIIVPRSEPPAVAELVRFCRARLAPHKVPRQFEFRDGLPRSAALKILRREL